MRDSSSGLKSLADLLVFTGLWLSKMSLLATPPAKPDRPEESVEEYPYSTATISANPSVSAEATVAVTISPLRQGVTTCDNKGDNSYEPTFVFVGRPVTAIETRSGYKTRCIVAFGRPGHGSEQLVLVAESSLANDAVSLRRERRERARKRLGICVADVVLVR